LERYAHFCGACRDVCRSHAWASLFAWAKPGGVTGWAQETCDVPRETAPYDEMKTERLQAAA
jgi:hypothetical protein